MMLLKQTKNLIAWLRVQIRAIRYERRVSEAFRKSKEMDEMEEMKGSINGS